jgi:hypothetical protein
MGWNGDVVRHKEQCIISMYILTLKIKQPKKMNTLQNSR